MSPQNPDLDSEMLLALPLPQLVQKVRSGELSPEAVLFSYLQKVRPGGGPACSFLPSLGKAVAKTWPGLCPAEALVGPPCQGLPGQRELEFCVCVCVREREGEGERGRERE